MSNQLTNEIANYVFPRVHPNKNRTNTPPESTDFLSSIAYFFDSPNNEAKRLLDDFLLTADSLSEQDRQTKIESLKKAGIALQLI